MGLDSVELVMAWEEYFEIVISNLEASKIRTVQDAVDCISSKLKFVESNLDVKRDVKNRLTSALFSLNLITKTPAPSDRVFDIVSFLDKDIWMMISEKVGYDLPVPIKTGSFGHLLEKLFPSRIEYVDTSLDRFVGLICALNYKNILTKGKISNNDEVLIAVVGITIDTQGINPYQIYPERSFVNDLGIN